MDYETGGRINRKEKRHKISLHPHIPCILWKWGFKQKVSRKVHVNTASQEEKEVFKKRQNKYLWISSSKKNIHKKQALP